MKNSKFSRNYREPRFFHGLGSANMMNIIQMSEMFGICYSYVFLD